jgi:hypothetical protein
MIDRTAQIGCAYRYTAQRVRTVELDGQRLEVRSLASPEVRVEMKDVFPPQAPTGLVAVPGFEDERAAGQASALTGEQSVVSEQRQPTIDLSWEPVMEAGVVGYRVYRRGLDGDASGAWRQLDSEIVPVAAYRDRTVAAGRRYGYRVTAVDGAGNESARSDEAIEMAPTQESK